MREEQAKDNSSITQVTGQPNTSQKNDESPKAMEDSRARVRDSYFKLTMLGHKLATSPYKYLHTVGIFNSCDEQSHKDENANHSC